MKIEKRKLNTRLTVFICSLLAVFFLSSLLVYMIFKGSLFLNSEGQPAGLGSPTEQQQKAGDDIKKQALDKNKASGEIKKGPSITITSAVQNGETLQIRSLITPLIDGGSCYLELTRDVYKVIKESSTQAQASSLTCRGFDVPISELGAGVWNIRLTVSTNAGSGEARRTVEIR